MPGEVAVAGIFSVSEGKIQFVCCTYGIVVQWFVEEDVRRRKRDSKVPKPKPPSLPHHRGERGGRQVARWKNQICINTVICYNHKCKCGFDLFECIVILVLKFPCEFLQKLCSSSKMARMAGRTHSSFNGKERQSKPTSFNGYEGKPPSSVITEIEVHASHQNIITELYHGFMKGVL